MHAVPTFPSTWQGAWLLLAALPLLLACACASPDLAPAAERSTQEDTAEVRPTRRELAQDAGLSVRQRLTTALSRSAANLRMAPRPDGRQQIEIASGFQHATMLVMTPDGGFTQRCVSDAREAIRSLDLGKK
jgi:hypothetical protein